MPVAGSIANNSLRPSEADGLHLPDDLSSFFLLTGLIKGYKLSRVRFKKALVEYYENFKNFGFGDGCRAGCDGATSCR